MVSSEQAMLSVIVVQDLCPLGDCYGLIVSFHFRRTLSIPGSPKLIAKTSKASKTSPSASRNTSSSWASSTSGYPCLRISIAGSPQLGSGYLALMIGVQRVGNQLRETPTDRSFYCLCQANEASRRGPCHAVRKLVLMRDPIRSPAFLILEKPGLAVTKSIRIRRTFEKL